MDETSAADNDLMFDLQDGIGRITFNRPQARNAFTFAMYERLAQICQFPEGFDFPRRELPGCFHYVGPLHDAADRPQVPFPYDRLDGRPLVYASLGTIQNRLRL